MTHFGKKWVHPVAFAFYDAPASVDGLSKNHSGIYEFLRRHTEFRIQREYAVSPNDAAADKQILGGRNKPEPVNNPISPNGSEI